MANLVLAIIEGRIRQYVRSEFKTKPLTHWQEQWSYLASSMLIETEMA